MKKRRTAVLAIAAVLLLAFAIRGAILRSAIGLFAGRAGYDVRYNALSLGGDRIVVDALDVRLHNDPLLQAQRATIGIHWPGVLSGAQALYGIRSVALDRPHLWIVRDADGGWNLPLHRGGQAPAAAGPSKPVAWTAEIRNGEVTVEDALHGPAHAVARLSRIDGRAAIDTAAQSSYTLRAQIDGGSALRVNGFARARNAISRVHLTAATVPVARLLSIFADPSGVRFTGGAVRDLDAYLYAHRGGEYHLTGSASVHALQFTIGGLRKPLRVAGNVTLIDGGLAARSIEGAIAGIPLHAAGALYGIPDTPSLSIGARGNGTLAQAKSLFGFSHNLPLAGAAQLRVAVDGLLADPVVLAAVGSARATYDGAGFDGLQTTAAYYHETVSVLSATAVYETLALTVRAGLDTGGADPREVLAVSGRGDAAVVPYLGHLTGTGAVWADAVADGPAAHAAGTGSIEARGNRGAIAGAPVRFTLDGQVTAPVFATQPGGGSLAGYVHRDRDGTLGIWADARGYRLDSSRAIGLADTGRIAGRLDATVALVGQPSRLAIFGEARASQAQIGPVQLDRVSSRFATTDRGTRLEGVAGHGAFGRFQGSGEFTGSQLALDGRYDGSFAELRSLTGDLGGRGALHGPVRLALSPAGTTVQTQGVDATGASVRGVPLGAVSGTLLLSNGTVAASEAIGSVSGGRAVVSGPLDRLHVVATGLRARSLRGTGLPLDAGTVAIAGTADLGGRVSAFEGSAQVRGGSSHGIALSGAGAIGLRNGLLRFDAAGLVGGAVSHAAGRFSEGGGAASASVETLGLPTRAIRAAGFAVPAQVSAPADFNGRLSLAAKAVTADGRLDVPVGFYGALPFTAARAVIDVDPRKAWLRDGSIAFGTTRITFNALDDADSGTLSGRIDAPLLDLSDFDLYFLRAGTLAGAGTLRASFERHNATLATSGGLRINGATIVRPAGDVAVAWSMSGPSVIAGLGSLSSEGNAVRTDFRVTPAAGAPLLAPFSGAQVEATVRARDENLLRDATLVIPPGFPSLGGRLLASGVVGGRYPNLRLAGTGTVRSGALGRFAFQQISVSLSADRHGATITDAQVHTAAGTAAGSGIVRFGRRPTADIRATADIPQVHDLLTTLANRPIPLYGSLQASARLTGALANPSIEGAAFLPGGTFAGVQIARAVASLALKGGDVELRDASISFAKGDVELAGTLPIRLSPFAVGPPGAPVGFDLTARGLELGNFSPLLPGPAQLAGTLAGRVGVNGTVGNPQLYGRLALSGGSIADPSLLSDPITAITGQMNFAGHGLTIDRLSAKAGSGDLNAAATAEIRSGEIAARATLRADRAVIGVPSLGRGTVDADVGFEKLPAQIASLAGTVALSDATIPFSALYAPAAGEGSSALPGLALDLHAVLGKNVRVRSANVDIGGTGAVALGGTLASPKLDGTLTSTGGTITFGNRAFRLQEGSVAFTPDSGFDPEITATASTRVPNSDPDIGRNATGTATVNLTVTGSLSNPATTLSSDPPYSKDQILGLLLGVPALGASLFSDPVTPGLPAGRTYASGGGNFVGQEALGVLNAQFTRLLLAPFETQLSNALGLSSVDINIGGTTALGVSARKVLGKDLNAIYSSTFIYPYRQSFGFELRARRYTSAQVLYYQTLAPVLVSSCPLVSPFENQGSSIAAAELNCSPQGFTLSIKQYFPPP